MKKAIVAARLTQWLDLPRHSVLWLFLFTLAFGLAVGVQIGIPATA